jgi:L-lactate permease
MKHLKLLKGLRIVLIATVCLQVVLMALGFEKIFEGRILFGTVEVIINFLMMMLNFHSISRIKKILKDG